MTPTLEMRELATLVLFLMAIGMFFVYVIVRIRWSESVDRDEQDFWSLLSARTLVAAIVAPGATILAVSAL